jgi:hypothetical protein
MEARYPAWSPKRHSAPFGARYGGMQDRVPAEG